MRRAGEEGKTETAELEEEVGSTGNGPSSVSVVSDVTSRSS